MTLEITPLTDANLLLALNNAAVPDVGELSTHKARWLTDHLFCRGWRHSMVKSLAWS